MRPALWWLCVIACGEEGPRTIEGTMIRRHVTEAGVTEVPVNLVAAKISAWSPATMETFAGNGGSNGAFAIENVASGAAYVLLERDGNKTYVVTDEAFVDLDFDVLGRADAVRFDGSSTALGMT